MDSKGSSGTPEKQLPKEEKKDKKKDVKNDGGKKDDKKDAAAAEKKDKGEKKDVTLQVVFLYDPLAAPSSEKDAKKKPDPVPAAANGWTKNIKFSFSWTTGEAMKMIRDKLKADGIKVDLVNYGLYVPPPVDVWCAEKAKLKTYKLNDNCRVEVKPIPKDVKALSTKDAVAAADNICQIEFADCNYHHSLKVDGQTKVGDIVTIITKQHPVDDVENYALVTLLEGVRTALNSDRLLSSYYVKTGMKKMEMLSFERVFYKVLFVVSGLDVRLRVPVSTTVKDAVHMIFQKFGEDLKKSEHFALVLANRNISKCAGMILGATDRLAFYVQKDKDNKFYLKYHKKDTSDLQLVKMKPERQLLKGETWVHVEARELNIKSQFLFDTELFITEVIQSVFDVNGIVDKVENWQLLKNGKQPQLDPLSKLSQFVGFGDKLLLKRIPEAKSKGKGNANAAASNGDGLTQNSSTSVGAEPSQAEVPGVFGAPPSTLEMCIDEGCRVPKILAELRHCILVNDGISFEGIFRVEGHNLKMKQFQADYNSHKPVDLGDNVHEASSLIKRFYDDLPNKLFGSLPDETLDACGNAEMALTVRKRLPTVERHLFSWLIRFLANVTQHSEQNKMDANNLGIVFGPLLALSRNPIHALMQTAKVVQILTSNIAHPPSGEEPLGEEEITDERQLEAMLSPDQLAQLAEWERVQKEKAALGGVGGRQKARNAVRGMDMGQLMRVGGNTNSTDGVAVASGSPNGQGLLATTAAHDDPSMPKSVSLDFRPRAGSASAQALPPSASTPITALSVTSASASGTNAAALFSNANGSGNVRGRSGSTATPTSPLANNPSSPNGSAPATSTAISNSGKSVPPQLSIATASSSAAASGANANQSMSQSKWTSAHSPSSATSETKRSGTVGSAAPASPHGSAIQAQQQQHAPPPASSSSSAPATSHHHHQHHHHAAHAHQHGNASAGSGGSGRSAAPQPSSDDRSDSSGDSDVPCQTLPDTEVNDDL